MVTTSLRTPIPTMAPLNLTLTTSILITSKSQWILILLIMSLQILTTSPQIQTITIGLHTPNLQRPLSRAMKAGVKTICQDIQDKDTSLSLSLSMKRWEVTAGTSGIG